MYDTQGKLEVVAAEARRTPSGQVIGMMSRLIGSIETVLVALNAAKVKYLIVGGVAVVLHGHLRTTADLDLVVQLTPENSKRAIDALSSIGFTSRAPVPSVQFADAAVRASWISDKGLLVFSLWSPKHPGLEVDLFVEEPFDFDEAFARAISVDLDTTSAMVVSIADLIMLKRKANRPIDLADIEALEALKGSDNGE